MLTTIEKTFEFDSEAELDSGLMLYFKGTAYITVWQTADTHDAPGDSDIEIRLRHLELELWNQGTFVHNGNELINFKGVTEAIYKHINDWNGK